MNDSSSAAFWRIIDADLYRYGSGVSARAFVTHYLLTPGFRYTFWMRASACLRQRSRIWRPVYYVCRWLLHRCAVRYGISIPYNTRIGSGLYIGHYGGVVVHHEAVIGRDCNINHGLTIGVKYGGKNPGVPTIGDRVFLGPGAKLIGGIALGDDVAVGANAVVTTSVPNRGVVAGIPAKLISLHGSFDYVVNTTHIQAQPGSLGAHTAAPSDD